MNEIEKLMDENTSRKDDCQFCKEAKMAVGNRTQYESILVYKIGGLKDGWFVTLSPRTGGDPKEDFTLQLMPCSHLTHFSQMNHELSKNYGIAFGKVCKAMAVIMTNNNPALKATSETRENGIAIAVYGKCTTWEEKKEHLHIKLFQFRGNLGQPSTVDSSFGRKDIFNDNGKYVKMIPVKKQTIEKNMLEKISSELIRLLK